MGAYSPAPVVTDLVLERVKTDVFDRVLAGFKAEGIDYRGILYAGLMIDNNVPHIVEFNVRFGDPETQAVLPRLKTDLLEVLLAVVERRLASTPIEWHDNASICVVLASGGYPGEFEFGFPITGLNDLPEGVSVIHAGTLSTTAGEIVTQGGRVLGVVGVGASVADAIKSAYKGVHHIQFKGKYFRTDIGQKALAPRP